MRLLLFLGLLLSGASAASNPPFAPEDVFRLTWASDPQVSPDGSFIVFTYNFMDIMEDRRRSNLWRMDSDGADIRPLTTGPANDSGARISPDGERVAYLSKDDKGVQIFVRWLRSGETLQVSRLAHSPGNLSWSPDGRWLAFTQLVPLKADTMGTLPEKPTGANWAEAPRIEQRLRFRADGRGTLPEGFSHVFVVPVTGGAPRQLTQGDYNHAGAIAWAADGQSLYITGNRHPDWETNVNDTEIYRVSLTEGEIVAITDRRGPDNAVTLSPDGKRLAWMGYDERYLGYQANLLYVMDTDGSQRQALLAGLDRSLSALVWAADGRSIYVQYDDEGLTRLASVSLDGKLTPVSDRLSGLSLSRPYTRHNVVTYPSSTPWIKLRTVHLRLRAIIEEDRS